jgi:hypothetical protein
MEAMEAFKLFQANFKALSEEQKLAKLQNIMVFLQQQNAMRPLMAFQELRACYPPEPLPRGDRIFREFLAWLSISDHREHPLVAHVISKG